MLEIDISDNSIHRHQILQHMIAAVTDCAIYVAVHQLLKFLPLVVPAGFVVEQPPVFIHQIE